MHVLRCTPCAALHAGPCGSASYTRAPCARPHALHAGHLLGRDENLFSLFEGARIDGNTAGGHSSRAERFSAATAASNQQQLQLQLLQLQQGQYASAAAGRFVSGSPGARAPPPAAAGWLAGADTAWRRAIGSARQRPAGAAAGPCTRPLYHFCPQRPPQLQYGMCRITTI